MTIPKAEVQIVGDDEAIGTKSLTELSTYTFDTTNWINLPGDKITTDTNNSITRVYAYKQKLPAGAETTTLFDTVQFANILEGSLPMGTKLEIDIKAYAIQTGSLNETGKTNEDKVRSAFEKYKAHKAAEYAYLITQSSVTNELTVGEVRVAVEEEFDKPAKLEPGISFKKAPYAVNTGNLPCFVRMRADFTTVKAASFAEMTDFSNDWEKDNNDGYYYYKKILLPGAETTKLFQNVEIKGTAEGVTEDMLEDFDIAIYAEAVQQGTYPQNQYKAAWTGYHGNN